MRVVGHLAPGAALLKSYQVAQTSAAGIPLLASTTAEAGLDAASTTDAQDMVGISYDSATYATAQVSGSSPEALCRVNIRPDAVIWARFSGSGTSGTALTARTVTSASTTGLTVTTGFDYSGTSVDSGTIWCYSGANVGQKRRITSVAATAATVTVAFANDIAVGDQFLHVPVWPMDQDGTTVTLTSDFTEIDASVAISTSAAEFSVIEILAKTAPEDGTTTSAALLVADDHFLGGRLT